MSNLLNGIAGILVAVAPNYVSLLVFRTLYGFGVKGGWVAGYVLSKNNISSRSCDLGKHSPLFVLSHLEH